MHRIIAKCPDVPDSTPYKLHHLHVFILLDANANIKDIQERLGHASARTTLNVYVDANPNKSFVAYIFTNALNETRRWAYTIYVTIYTLFTRAVHVGWKYIKYGQIWHIQAIEKAWKHAFWTYLSGFDYLIQN